MTVFICEKIIIISVIAVFIAVLLDFIIYNGKNAIKKSKQSVVATGSMIGFIAIYYIVLRLNLGVVKIESSSLIVLGTAMILVGTIINIVGRLTLKGNWANHIKIYKDHYLVNQGIYKSIRHPLYASIMLMLFGGSLVYRNWLSFVMTLFVFIPFMFYRARQEESLLQEELLEYKEYKKNTGMFFPKFWR